MVMGMGMTVILLMIVQIIVKSSLTQGATAPAWDHLTDR